MEITLIQSPEISQEKIQLQWAELSPQTIEALIVELYRANYITFKQTQRLLHHSTWQKTVDLLQRYDCELYYDQDDLDDDIENLRDFFEAKGDVKKVVSNTSPLRYLIDIEEQAILPELFGKIIIPQAVFQELTHSRTPIKIRQVMQSYPAWIEIQSVVQSMDISLTHLDWGEREALLLVEQIEADLFLVDDKVARLTAQERRVRITGTLGVLELATRQQLVNLPQAIEKLQRTNIKLSPSVIKQVLDRYS